MRNKILFDKAFITMLNNRSKINKFWSKVNILSKNECWEWKSSKTGANYGIFYVKKIDGKEINIMAHRISYCLSKNKLPSEVKVVMHSCDNPSCVNPKHLSSGTKKLNSIDMVNKKRQGHQKLSINDVIRIAKDTRPYKLIQKDYNVSKHCISDIKRGKSYSHLNIVRIPATCSKSGRSGKISEKDAIIIYLSSDNPEVLAKKYNVSPSTIYDVRSQRSWKSITSNLK